MDKAKQPAFAGCFHFDRDDDDDSDSPFVSQDSGRAQWRAGEEELAASCDEAEHQCHGSYGTDGLPRALVHVAISFFPDFVGAGA